MCLLNGRCLIATFCLYIVYIKEKISLRVLQNKIQSSIIGFADIESALMGHRQTVRHWTLTPASQGSNPCGPVRVVERFNKCFEVYTWYWIYFNLSSLVFFLYTKRVCLSGKLETDSLCIYVYYSYFDNDYHFLY